MSNNHILTKNIGNLRGFSTDSIFMRPANVADLAINMVRAPDKTLTTRRGYQCEIASIGGLGDGTFDNPTTGQIEVVTLSLDGLLYKRLTRNIYLYYDGRVTGSIISASQTNPAVLGSPLHGLQTGAEIIVRNVQGMVELNNLTYTITVIDPNSFSLDGVDATGFTAYTTGGTWTIAFTDNRYLEYTVFTDPRFINSPAGQSITNQTTVHRAAQINGNQVAVNVIVVDFGHELTTGDVVKFNNSASVTLTRTLTATSATSITISGAPVTVSNNTYIDQFFDIPFGKGFDVTSPFSIQDFLDIITNPTTGVFGLKVSVNGDTSYPAAFLPISEPIQISPNIVLEIDFFYWEAVNKTVPITFLGSSSTAYQDSNDFENASMATVDDVIYIANGIDFPQKYDNQNVYRAGMPMGERPLAVDNTGVAIKPFPMATTYLYGVTYEQVDNINHVAEGSISETRSHTVGGASAAIDVTVNDLVAGSGWNTDCAIATGGAATSVYGPDIEGFYYQSIPVTSNTMNFLDNAFYNDLEAAVVNGAQVSTNAITVDAGYGLDIGDTVIFQDTTPSFKMRTVTKLEPTVVTIDLAPVSVADNATIAANRQSKVYGDVAIIDGNQSNVNTIVVKTGHSVQMNDVVAFPDSRGRIVRRNVTAVAATTITIDGIAVNVLDLILINAEVIRSGVFQLQTRKLNPIVLGAAAPISNNLRINIWRTPAGGTQLLYAGTIPNNSFIATQTYLDQIPDSELGFEFPDPIRRPDPPPVSKYLLAYGDQLLYGGGKLGETENDDNVFFSQGNLPESVPAATNFFSVPSPDDSVSGMGVAGTTLIVFKNRSVYAITGDLLTSQFQVTPIAPGSNIGCVAFATIKPVGSLLYFLSSNGVYAITENQFFPTDEEGLPVPISRVIDVLFRTEPYLPQYKFVFKRAVAINYTKDNQYLLFMPCEDEQSTIRTANANSVILCYDYEGKNWFTWNNMNAAGGFFVIQDNLYFHERRFSGVAGNTANLYIQHRFYRLIDYADHAGPLKSEWRSSWEDLGQPQVRKKFVRCMLLMDRVSHLYQSNNPVLEFATYKDRIPNLKSTIATVTTVNQTRNTAWSATPWSWNFWGGYQDSFISIALKQGTVAKSLQVGFTHTGINATFKLAGAQLEIVPENRATFVR